MRFLPLLLVLLFCPLARAQTRWEGTLVQFQNGVKAKAQLSVEAPDQMRIEIARDDAAGVPAQIIVASGDQTLQWSPATRQLRRARFNILKQWQRGWNLTAGGPANYVFAGAAKGTVEEGEGRFMRRDKVLFGGGGENAYYAATKVAAGLYPAQVELGAVPSGRRVERDAAGQVTMSALVWAQDNLPAWANVTAGGQLTRFRYDLKKRAEPFPAATWTIPEASEALAEELDLRAPAAYGNDASDLLNQGVALWRGAGDFVSAEARFDAASRQAPRATAPRLAAFEMAMQTRQLNIAQSALESTAALGLNIAELEARRARISLARRDWDGAAAALDKALADAPDSYLLKMARAQVWVSQGDLEKARALWRQIIEAPAPTPLPSPPNPSFDTTSTLKPPELAEVASAQAANDGIAPNHAPAAVTAEAAPGPALAQAREDVGGVPVGARVEAATLWARSYAGETVPPPLLSAVAATGGNGTALPPAERIPWAILARALAQLESGAASDNWPPFDAAYLGLNGVTVEPSAEATLRQNAATREALALAYERAGLDEKARALWESLEQSASDEARNRARAHLMSLAARRGDIGDSLDAFGRLRAALSSQGARDAATQALFDAWQKAFRRENLGAALANRAAATRADDEGARLLLAYQDTYGDLEARTAAVDNGLSRAPDAPFWLGRKAEMVAGEASAQLISNNAGAARRDALLARARELLGRAIEGDKKSGGDGLFYAQQRALIAAQGAARFNSAGGVSDAGRAIRERKAAGEALDELVAGAPDDPDALLTAALAWQSFGGDEGTRRTLDLAQKALLSQPDDGPRHALILAARQAMAVAYARLKQPSEAATQYQLLLLEAREAGEQAGIAANSLALLESAGDAASAASLVARIAREPWDYSAARAALEALAPRVSASPLLAAMETEWARESSDAAAKLAWGTVAQTRLRRAQTALQVPNAPGSADAELERATRDLSAATAALRAATPTDYLVARVAAWRAEFGALQGDAALEQLRRAAQIEARSPSLRLALAEALPDEQASAELRRAAQALPDELETQRRVSLLALELGQNQFASQTSESAFNAAARDPFVGAAAFQRTAFARAKILYLSGDTTRALELYNGLALPQWTPLDRAAALLALRARYLEADRADDAARLEAKLNELGIPQAELRRAAAFVDDVEN